MLLNLEKVLFLKENHVIGEAAFQLTSAYLQDFFERHEARIVNEEIIDMFMTHVAMSMKRLVEDTQEEIDVPVTSEEPAITQAEVDLLLKQLDALTWQGVKRIFTVSEKALFTLYFKQLF